LTAASRAGLAGPGYVTPIATGVAAPLAATSALEAGSRLQPAITTASTSRRHRRQRVGVFTAAA
jgi:hypothetical protein